MTHSLRDLNDKNDPQYDKGRLTEFYSDPEKVVRALNLISLFAIRIRQCCFLGTLPAIAYYESPVFEVGLFLPRS